MILLLIRFRSEVTLLEASRGAFINNQRNG